MIMYGKDHFDRANTLATTVGEKAAGSSVLSDQRFIPKTPDWTLTVWGHGGPDTFCEMANISFCEGIKAWKKMNPTLKTVEIITCDARHNAYDYLSSYAKSVAKYVKLNGIDVAIKALPAGQATTGESVLWASANTSSFCHIDSLDSNGYNWANQRLQTLLPQFQDDCNQASQELAKEAKNHRFSVIGGYFGSLRGILGVVNGND